MLSFWEDRSFLKFDLIVVGGGIVGLSTAIQFKKDRPNAKVLILERGVFPSGASTRNAGFACFGSLTEILDDLNTMKVEEVKNLVEKRYIGLRSIRGLFGDKALGYYSNGGFELITEQEEKYLDRMEYVNSILTPIFGEDVFSQVRDIQTFGFSDKVKYLVKNQFEGELDSGKFLELLWETAQLFKVKILTGALVENVDLDKKEVQVRNPIYQNRLDFSADKIAICTNAFAGDLIENLNIKPGRGLVMVSKPLKNKIPWNGSFHYDMGYVYFRNIENRLLIGGGRNLDIKAEETTKNEVNPTIKAYLSRLSEEVILPNENLEFEYEWTGIMGFGENKKPVIQLLTEDIGLAARLGGMGVAIGWQTAFELVALLEK
jgi:gamma-glutamylputrescine oxidase